MKYLYIIDYLNENNFKQKESTLKKYNMLAYKKLVYEYFPQMREGNFLGNMISFNEEINSKSFELMLPTDALFVKVHGPMVLHYTVYISQNLIMLKTITPEAILNEGHKTELKAYKGVMVSRNNASKDLFKIQLLNSLNNISDKE